MPVDADALAEVISLAVEMATEPLVARIAVLEHQLALTGRDGKDGQDGRPGEKGLDGRDGRDGKDSDPIVVAALVRDEVQKAIATLPPARDGAPGPPGRDGIEGPPGPAGPSGPAGARGERGEKGLDGKDGAPGPPGPPGPAGERGEKGLDGVPGRDGRDGLPGVPGPMGEKGLDGKDGKDGTDGADGLNGKDGLGFDDVDCVLDESRGYLFRFTRDGVLLKEQPIAIPWDATVWRMGRLYPRGAGVTWGGAWWIAQTDTRAKPGESKDWRLAVKAGRDGKPGLAGGSEPQDG